MHQSLRSLGRSIFCILVASTAAQAETANEVEVPVAAAATAGMRTVPSVATRPDSLPDREFTETCGQEGIALAELARTHLSSKCRFEIAVRNGSPQLFAVLTVVACNPTVGQSCTVAQARLSRLGEHRIGQEVQVRVFVDERESNDGRRQDRLVGSLLGFTNAIQTFTAVRRAAFARSDQARKQALRANTVRVLRQEDRVRSARTASRSANAGLIARQERQRQLEYVSTDVVRHLFATLRYRGMMRRVEDNQRWVSPSVTEWLVGKDGRMRLRFLGPAAMGQRQDATPRDRFRSVV